MRTSLLRKKTSKLYEITVYLKSSVAPLDKICPMCNTFSGHLRLLCRCGYKFPKSKKIEKTKTYSTNSPYKLWQFWARYQGKPKRKKQLIPNAKEADKILKKMYSE